VLWSAHGSAALLEHLLQVLLLWLWPDRFVLAYRIIAHEEGSFLLSICVQERILFFCFFGYPLSFLIVSE
jgi:hypothetical protein